MINGRVFRSLWLEIIRVKSPMINGRVFRSLWLEIIRVKSPMINGGGYFGRYGWKL